MTPFLEDVSELADELSAVAEGQQQAVVLCALMTLAATIIENHHAPPPSEAVAFVELCKLIVGQFAETHDSRTMRES